MLSAFLKFTVISSSFLTGLILGSHSREETKATIKSTLQKFTEFNPIIRFLTGGDIEKEIRFIYPSSGNFKGGRYYPGIDIIDNLEEFLRTANPINKGVIAFLGIAALTGSAFILSDLMDMFSNMANNAHRGVAAGLVGGDHQFHRLFPMQMNPFPEHQRQQQQQDQQQNQQRATPRTTGGGGPIQNPDFIARMEFVGARQPPASYRPQVISEDEATTVPCCVVCLTNVRDTVCEPCGHLSACFPCAMALAVHEEEHGSGYGPHCPVCRQRVIAFSYVMVP